MKGVTYKNMANAAAKVFHRGNFRLSARMYLEAFQACPNRWDYNRWQIFHGFTSILQEEYFEASMEQHIDPLKAIVEDKHELKLFRIEAAFTTGLLLWLRGEREDAADFYREAIQLAEKVPKKERSHKVMASIASPCGNYAMGVGTRRMEDLIPSIVDDCKTNLHEMECSIFERMMMAPPTQRLRSDGTPMPLGQQFTGVPVGPMRDEDTLTPEELDRLLQVGGERCDCCGKSREEAGRKLFDVCVACKKAYYCGRECQVKQWKEGHKKCCRKPGVFKVGDYIRLHGLKSKPELNGMLVRVIGEDPQTKGRWEVKVQGETSTISVASEKMEQLRPLK